MDLTNLLRQIDHKRDMIQKKRPLAPEEVRELDQYFKIGTTYTSNALEGNSLTLTETKVLLEDGITVGGKPLRDCYEASGHAKAYDYMLEIARSDKLIFSEAMILRLHELFYSGIDPDNAGKYRSIQVFISGTEYLPPESGEIPACMTAFVAGLNQRKSTMHPVQLAAYAHRRLVDIHPFVDGNGRTARLLMNLIFVSMGYLAVSIPPVLRTEYIQALQAAQRMEKPDDTAFITLIAECQLEAQRDFCRMFRVREEAER